MQITTILVLQEGYFIFYSKVKLWEILYFIPALSVVLLFILEGVMYHILSRFYILTVFE